MAAILVATSNVEDGQGVGVITPNPANTKLTAGGSVVILEGSVVAPHGSHTGTITIDGGLAPAKITFGPPGSTLRIATVDSTASCGGGIQTTGSPPTAVTGYDNVDL